MKTLEKTQVHGCLTWRERPQQQRQVGGKAGGHSSGSQETLGTLSTPCRNHLFPVEGTEQSSHCFPTTSQESEQGEALGFSKDKSCKNIKRI